MSKSHFHQRHRSALIALSIAFGISLLVHGGVWWFLSTNITPTPKRTWVQFSFKEPAKLVGLGQSTPQPQPPSPPEKPPELPLLPQEAPSQQAPPAPKQEDPSTRSVKPKPKKKKKRPQKVEKKNTQKKKLPRKTPKKITKRKKTPPKMLIHQDHVGEVPFKTRAIPSIRSVAPGNAALTAVLDLGRLRVSPWKRELLNLFKAYPDYHRVVGLSDIDPTRVYDKLLITTADPTSFTQTLMIANLRKAQSLEATQKQFSAIVREELTWETRSGVTVARPHDVWWVQRIKDPRLFAIPAPNVLALAQPDLLPYLAERGKTLRTNPRRFFPPLPPAIGVKDGTLPAVLVVELSKMHLALSGPAASLPKPQALRLVVHDDKRPLIRLRLAFLTPQDAQKFLKELPPLRDEMASKVIVKIMGYGPLLKRIQLTQDSDPNAVYLELRGTPEETRRILRLMARTMESRTRSLHPQAGDLPPDPSVAAQNALQAPLNDPNPSDANSKDTVKPDHPSSSSLLRVSKDSKNVKTPNTSISGGSSPTGGFGTRRGALFGKEPPSTDVGLGRDADAQQDASLDAAP